MDNFVVIAAPPRLVTACQGTIATLTCPNSATIQVIFANYGRTDSATCVTAALNGRCGDSVTNTGIVALQCNSLTTCTIVATAPNFPAIGPACPIPASDYLQVAYGCVVSNSNTGTATSYTNNGYAQSSYSY